MIEKEVMFEKEEGIHLSGVLKLPEVREKRPAVIVCHGFKSHKGDEFIIDIANHLSYFRFVILRFDFSHHGDSHGEPEFATITKMVHDLKKAIDFIEKHPAVDKNNISVIGHDLGAMIAILAASEDKRIKALVTIAARSDISEFIQSHFRETDITEWINTGWHTDHEGDRIHVGFYHDSKKHDILEAAKKVICPKLILHGTDDMRTPYSELRELLYHFPEPKEFEEIEGADHWFRGKEHRDFLLERIVVFLNRWLR